MSDTRRVFVNGRGIDVAAGATVADAVAACDPELAARVARGEAYVTDGRGITVATDAPLAAGAILRVVVSARRGGAGGTDADA